MRYFDATTAASYVCREPAMLLLLPCLSLVAYGRALLLHKDATRYCCYAILITLILRCRYAWL